LVAGRALASADLVAAETPAPTEAHRLRLEVGLEYDTNPQRAEIVPGGLNPTVTPSALARGVASLATSSRLGERHTLDWAISLAGKRFFRNAANTEDVFLVDDAGHWTWRVVPVFAVGLSAAYSEAVQRHPRDFQDTPATAALPEPRDYRAGSGSARVSYFGLPGFALTASLGGRAFFYKPVPDASFRAPTANLEARYQRDTEEDEVEWDLAAGATFEDRRFDGFRQISCANDSGCVSAQDPTTFQHDRFWQAHLDVTRTGAVLAGLRYAFQLNDSNSFQNTVARHLFSARLAVALPFGLFLTARAELVWARYADPINLTVDTAGRPYATFEDENRSQARVELSRALPGGFELSLRWSGYASALGTAGDYRRQTFLLATAWRWD
jgi:hypothetical protein